MSKSKLLRDEELDAEAERIRIVLIGPLDDLPLYERESLKNIPTLLAHIEAQGCQLTAQGKALDAADKVAELFIKRQEGPGGSIWACSVCHMFWFSPTKENHATNCPVGAYHKACAVVGPVEREEVEDNGKA